MFSRKSAMIVLFVSGAAHLVVFAVLTGGSDIPMAVFGVLYLIIGYILTRPGNIGLWLGAIIPVVGAIGGVSANWPNLVNPVLIIFLVLDLYVILTCALRLRA